MRLKKFFLGVAFTFVFISGCIPQRGSNVDLITPTAVTNLTTIPSSVVTKTTGPLKTYTPTFITSPEFTQTFPPTITPAPPVEARLSFQCADFKNFEKPFRIELAGSLLILKSFDNRTAQAYFLDLHTQTERPLIQEDGWQSLFESISINGKYLAFKKANLNGNEDLLAIEDVVGNVQSSFTWQDNWYSLKGWINDDTLLLDTSSGSFLLNPFTQEGIEIKYDFPDLAGPIGVGVDYWGPVIFSPTLDLAIYPREPGEQGLKRIVLWDLKNAKPVAYLSSLGDPFGGVPVWDANGEKFMMALRNTDTDWAYDNFIRELFVITKQGVVTQITNLAAYLPERALMDGYTWSPDTSKVAFWLNYGFDKKQNDKDYRGLAIADITNKQTLALCLKEPSNPASRLVWSPDGQGIMLITTIVEKDYLVWIDINSNEAIPLIPNYWDIIGWMEK